MIDRFAMKNPQEKFVYRRPNKNQTGHRKSAWDTDVQTTLRKITKIRTWTHRLIMTAQYGHFDYNALKIKYGFPDQFKLTGKSRKRGYTWLSRVYIEGKLFSFFSTPTDTYLRFWEITTTTSDPNPLIFLSQVIPGLELSKIEYRVDFHCDRPETVAHLFYILRHCLWFERQHRTSMIGKKYDGWDTENPENHVMHVYNRAKNDEIRKVTRRLYERGPDWKKKGEGWKREDIDRVRLEFNLKRRTKPMAGSGLKTLEDLIAGPRFVDMLFNEIQFRAFNSAQLPREWEDYLVNDEDGNPDCFQELYQMAKSKRINPIQYLIEPDNFKELMKSIRKSLIRSDKKWKDKVNKLIV